MNHIADAVAVIGLGGCFPGAPTIEALWERLCSTEATQDRTVGFAARMRPDSADDAGIMARRLLECAREALRSTGDISRDDTSRIGVFTGVSGKTMAGQNFDSELASEISVDMGIHGPAVTIHSPWSLALAVVDMACQSLRGGECDLAIAGEVHISDGEGVVALKRMVDALLDGNRILAVIRGTAAYDANAPAADTWASNGNILAGMAALTRGLAEIPVETIGYVEAYSVEPTNEQVLSPAAPESDLRTTGIKSPVPISMQSLLHPFTGTAGIAGLIKAVLVAGRGMFPPERQQGEGDPAERPFSAANPLLRDWQSARVPRRAVISALGRRGGAYVVLEQPPAPAPGSSSQQGAPRTLSQRPALANEYTPPSNRLESALAGVWQEHLGIDRVGIHDNFFELGGNSILGIKIIAVLKEWLHQEIPTVSLYDGPTVSALARVITQRDGRTPGSYEVVRQRGDRRRHKIQRLAQIRQGSAD